MSHAALLAVEQWYRERVATQLIPEDPAAARIRASAVAVLSSGGELSPVQRSMLRAAIEEVQQRPRDAFPHSADVLHLARLVEAAAGT
ncbi:hypothetical protein COUCH_10330 [Couchioplanes caeruleus]|uniref:hypothetical protein n=1 Tax=Couchioplanes caeruleus TaxID=56438 RepID=UPI0020C06920|nr:hypothetical protein [Couchioplanes caeruleus]UQU66629.1 hypothetical protein COUCH_10330 [Couchioplanes caeruleus]